MKNWLIKLLNNEKTEATEEVNQLKAKYKKMLDK